MDAWQKTALGIWGGARVVVNGGTFVGPNGAFIWNSGASLTINSGTFKTNLTDEQIASYTYTTYLGNAVAAEGGWTEATKATVTINGGVFEGGLHAIQNGDTNYFIVNGVAFQDSIRIQTIRKRKLIAVNSL